MTLVQKRHSPAVNEESPANSDPAPLPISTTWPLLSCSRCHCRAIPLVSTSFQDSEIMEGSSRNCAVPTLVSYAQRGMYDQFRKTASDADCNASIAAVKHLDCGPLNT